MPRRSPKPCRVPGCPGLASAGQMYCEIHKKNKPPGLDRGSSAQRGYGSRWQRIRKMFLAEHPLCCDPFGLHANIVVPATDVDHIIPRRAGGSDAADNLQALCHSCHSKKTNAEQGRGVQKPGTLNSQTARWLLGDSRESGERG